MVIRNDYQFRIYFYNWIAILNSNIFDGDGIDYEKWLKQYLMTPGYRCSVLNEKSIRVSVVIHDLDKLYQVYLNYGEI